MYILYEIFLLRNSRKRDIVFIVFDFWEVSMKNKIKYFRLQLGLTLIDLSNLTGLSIGYLCHLENGGRNNPSFASMTKLLQH